MTQALNLDLEQFVVVDTMALPWSGSRADGVVRKPLEREQAESGRATSIVQFEPGAGFPPHTHARGEEILVLDGVFSDETGDYPAGTYLRNPPGSRHAPHSDPGCTLFVKLEQFAPGDREKVVLNTRLAAFQPGIGGLRVLHLLYSDNYFGRLTTTILAGCP